MDYNINTKWFNIYRKKNSKSIPIQAQKYKSSTPSSNPPINSKTMNLSLTAKLNKSNPSESKSPSSAPQSIKTEPKRAATKNKKLTNPLTASTKDKKTPTTLSAEI